MSNPNYGVYNTASPGDNAAFAIEKLAKRKFTNAAAVAHPLLALLIMGKPNETVKAPTEVNYGGEVSGRRLIIPVISAGQTTAPDGVTDANELTAMTWNRTVGATQAEYIWSHYRGNFTVTNSEETLLSSGEGIARGNIMDMKIAQMAEEFNVALSGDLASTTVESREKLMGVWFALSAANTVGGIDQSATTNWQASVDSSTTILTLSAIDNRLHRQKRLGKDTDLLVATFAGSNMDVYGKFKSLVQPSQLVTSVSTHGKYGFSTFEYCGIPVMLDAHGPSGRLAGLRTDEWYFHGYDKPTFKKQPITGTDATGYVYTWWGCLGCGNPKRNFVMSALVG